MDGDEKGGDADERRRAGRSEWSVPASLRSARRARPAFALALVASTALHVAAFVLWRGATPFAGEPATGGSPSATARPGGGAMAGVRVALPRDRSIPPPPRPVLAIDAPRVRIEEAAASTPGPEDLARPAGGRLGPGGLGEPGAGSGAGTGAGGEYVSPVPRTVVPHWDPPPTVRGMEVTVRVHVDARGRPTGDVKLEPPTPDRGFNREIVERVRRMEYRPARKDGVAVAGWARITFVF